MDHKTAERTMAVEKYLLDEFNPEERDEFEEHFFSCSECARDIKLGSAFMTHAKASLQSIPETAPARSSAKQPKRTWLRWFSPAFSIPSMAFMLGIVAFQNLVQLPALHQSLEAMNAPAVLPSADLKSGISRGEESVVYARAGEIFQLTIDIPDTARAPHTAELDDTSGRRLWTLPIPADAPKDGLSLRMPGSLPSGTYSLVVRLAGSGESDAVSRYKFELRRS